MNADTKEYKEELKKFKNCGKGENYFICINCKMHGQASQAITDSGEKYATDIGRQDDGKKERMARVAKKGL
uniref:Uncharacterized protein n=1 Tax=Panagrolaimus sp. ES5 TaxID=591445 RepID=A0AC34G955_9BILA